ncbi:hypothetical protein [Streptosporangium canum]|uniref:hypothetical protein n=1 Tax=Streptosporangium canum TaxID=324952 RepID=UPI0037968611
MRDCCLEPVPGPPVTPWVLSRVWTAVGPLGCGGWPEPHSLALQHRHSILTLLDDVLAGLYLAVDADGNLRWLGKAHRNGGVGARIREHLTHPERARVYTELYVVGANPFSPSGALAAAEGKAADLLALRGQMGSRTWPSSDDWLRLVTSRGRGRASHHHSASR